MDILQELPLEQWPVLQEKLKNLWPLNLPGYYFLYTNIKHPKIREAFQFKVYCPYGDMNNGFIGINVKRPHNQEIILYSLTEDTSLLEEALLTSKIIDWTGRLSFDPITSTAFKLLEKIKDKEGFTKFIANRPTMFIMEKNSELFTDLRQPKNTYVAPLKEEHIPRINAVWPHRYPESPYFFSTLISGGVSYGLYSNSHELLAWVMFNEGHYLCHLYCEEAHRRKGYAEYILKYVVNDELRRGNDVYAYVVPGNEKSPALFRKLGFNVGDEAAFVTVYK